MKQQLPTLLLITLLSQTHPWCNTCTIFVVVVVVVEIAKYLLNAYYAPDTWNREMNITNTCFHGIYFLSEKISEWIAR